MKRINLSTSIYLVLSSVNLIAQQPQWSGTGNATNGQSIYRTGSVGVNMPAAPADFQLEVNGGIGLLYGTPLACISNGNSLALSQRNILFAGWHPTGQTTGNDYLALFTPGNHPLASKEKLIITQEGRVSIGAGMEPAAKFEIYHDQALGINVGDNLLLSRNSGNYGITGSGSKYTQSVWLRRYGNQTGWNTANIIDGISIDGNYQDPSLSNATTAVRTWWVRDPAWNSQQWGDGNVTQMQLDDGKLGINTFGTAASTRGRLQVDENVTNGSGSNAWLPTKAFVARTNHSADLAFCIVADVNRDRTVAYTINNRNFNGIGVEGSPFTIFGNGQVELNSKLPEDIQNQTNLQPVLYVRDALSSGGDVNFKIFRSGTTVIGKRRTWGTHNDAKLAVDGKITCQEVIVTQTGWADFVFEKSYKLMPLNDLEKYYREHHHLPQIPSANEITTNGNDLGKTDALLLQKIEELTLYVVELKKELDAYKSEKH